MVSNGCQPYFFLLCQGKKGERYRRWYLQLLAFRVIYRLPREKGVAELGDSDKGRKQGTEEKIKSLCLLPCINGCG